MRAEIAHLVCEQIARGGLRFVEGPLGWRDPIRYSGESEEVFAQRKARMRIAHIDASMSAEQRNAGNREACRNAARWLDEAGDHAAAEAVRGHIRFEWGHAAAAEAA